jgi:hypothetical protein
MLVLRLGLGLRLRLLLYQIRDARSIQLRVGVDF